MVEARVVTAITSLVFAARLKQPALAVHALVLEDRRVNGCIRGAADFKQVAYNLSHTPAVMNAATSPVLVPQQPFVLGAKSLRRLKVAAKAVRYYNSIGRPLTPANMHYSNCLKNFEVQWKSLKEKMDKDEPDVPKVTRSLAVTKWSESFVDSLNQVYGV